MKYNTLLFALLLSSQAAAKPLTTPEEWVKYDVDDRLMSLSMAISNCMAKKTFGDMYVDVALKSGLPFYAQCMKKHKEPVNHYGTFFKSQTIARYVFMVKRANDID